MERTFRKALFKEITWKKKITTFRTIFVQGSV